MRVLIIKAVEEAHGYSQFNNSLARALVDIGHFARVSDQTPHIVDKIGDAGALARELQAERFDAVLSFSSFFGSAATVGGASVFDALGVDFIGWQLDHPIYAPESLTRRLNRRLALYCNPNHQRFAEAIRLPGRAATLLPGTDPRPPPARSYDHRPWSVFVAASWNGVPQRLWETLEDSPGKALLVAVLEHLMADPAASLIDAFEAASAALGLGARLGDDPEFDDLMVTFLRDPLTYLRHFDRIEIIRALADSGLPLTICGPGWRGHLGERSNVTYVDRWVAFEALPGLYEDARIVVNLNAGNGGCERAVHAAMAGAAVVSDYSAPLSDLLGDGGGLTVFHRGRPAEIVQRVGDLLESDCGEVAAEAGRRRVQDAGLWRHRAQDIVDFIAGRGPAAGA